MTKSKKIDLAAEAAALSSAPTQEVEDDSVTEEVLFEHCPKEFLAQFKKAKTPAARADLLYTVDQIAGQRSKEVDTVKKFVTKLEQWFIQELPTDDATGIAGKLARVSIKSKEIATAADWPTFYAHIKKKGEFELLNKAINQKAVKERWDAGKQVPGLGKFTKKTISLTKVK